MLDTRAAMWISRCRFVASTVQAAFAVNPRDGRCAKGAALEVGDDLLDDRVVAVVRLKGQHVVGGVGNHRVVPPCAERPVPTVAAAG